MYVVSEDELNGHFGDKTPPTRPWLLLVNYAMLTLLLILTALFVLFSTYAQPLPDNTDAILYVHGQLFHHFLVTVLTLLLAVQIAKHGPISIRSYVPRRITHTYWLTALMVILIAGAWYYVFGIKIEVIFSNITSCLCMGA